MVDYLNSIKNILENDNTKLIYYISVYTSMCLLDFILGSVLTYISDKEKFLTKEFKKGFTYKVMSIITVILILPIVLMFDDYSINFINVDSVGLKSYYFIVIVLTFSELKSVIGHLNSSDGKKHDGFNIVVNIIQSFFSGLFGDKNE